MKSTNDGETQDELTLSMFVNVSEQELIEFFEAEELYSLVCRNHMEEIIFNHDGEVSTASNDNDNP